MAAKRKSRSLKKCLAKGYEEFPSKDDGSGGKVRQKKRMRCDVLGSQWSKDELEDFYEAYRKYGKNWKKVAGSLCNRSVEMVEALYNMNRAYLSLPEGTASVVGLIAMMSDHYNIMDESDNEFDSSDRPEKFQKPKKRGRNNYQHNYEGYDGHIPDLLHFLSTTSNNGCLPLSKKKRSCGGRARVVGQRTPRFPVSHLDDNKSRWEQLDAMEDEVAGRAVLALAESLQREASPQVSQPHKNGRVHTRRSVARKSKLMHDQLEKATAATNEYIKEGSLGSKEVKNGELNEYPNNLVKREGIYTVQVKQKGNRLLGKKRKVECDESTEARGTGKLEHSRPYLQKKSRKHCLEDESTALDALYRLADVSTKLAPSSTIESDCQMGKRKSSGTSGKRQKSLTADNVKCIQLQRNPIVGVNAIPEAKKLVSRCTAKLQRKRGESAASKTSENESHTESHLSGLQNTTEALVEDAKKCMVKAKSLASSLPKQPNSLRPAEQSCSGAVSQRPGVDSSLSTVRVASTAEVKIPTKKQSRRKRSQKALVPKILSSPEVICYEQPSNRYSWIHYRTPNLKEEVYHCLSSQMLRRWCGFEWFYSAIDFPWYAKNEFVEYLNHVSLGNIPKLTRAEWGVIRSSLGKPRRLSQKFLQEEREKLEQYRESVRTHSGLPVSARGLQTVFVQPLLSIGRHVIARHPSSREFHDGSVLAVDRNRCKVQFDRHELGVEFIMDIDCMLVNQLENVPVAVGGRNIPADRSYDIREHKINKQFGDWKTADHANVDLTKNLEISQIYSPSYPRNMLYQGDTVNATLQAKPVDPEVIATRKVEYKQTCALGHIQGREADIKDLSGLRQALDNQVSSGVKYLRYGNAYEGKPPAWVKPMAVSGAPVELVGPCNQSVCVPQEAGSHVEILKSSRIKAHRMVEASTQALSTLKEGEDAFGRIREALGSSTSPHCESNFGTSSLRFSASLDPCNNSSFDHNATTPTEPKTSVNVNDANTNFSSNGSVCFPKDLISACVSTLIMIQSCTERQYPPEEVAQMLSAAIRSLRPCCSQNLPIYREIQMCMGVVKNQLLALVPT